MAKRAFIVGGTGQIGRAVARDLLDRGWDVILSHRGRRPHDRALAARGASLVLMDRDQPRALAAALTAGADAVIDTVAFTATHADQLLELESNVGSIVVISSASVYRDHAGRTLDEAGQNGFPDFPQPITESQVTVDPGPETYSTQKVALERRLLDHSRRPVTILRPCAIHGPHSVHPREWWFVKRMLDGRKIIPLAYNGQSRFHTSATTNIAGLVLAALEKPGMRILNVADPAALTVAEIGVAIADKLGYRGQLLPVEGDSEGIGHTPWSVPAPFTLDTGAAQTLGYVPATTYEDAIGAACDWLVTAATPNWRECFPVLASYPGDLFDYSAEDEFLSRAERRVHSL